MFSFDENTESNNKRILKIHQRLSKFCHAFWLTV